MTPARSVMPMPRSSSMEHASLAGPTTHGPVVFMQHALWAAPGSIEPATEPPPGLPPHDWDWDAPREPGTEMARMQQLGGDRFEEFKRRDLELLATVLTHVATHRVLMDTEILGDWAQVLQALGADMGNIQTMACLAQQGNAGRIYANALLIKWMKQAVDTQHLDYIVAPLAMQADLRKARMQIDRPPAGHYDHMVCHHGLALRPYWLQDLKRCVDPGAWDDPVNIRVVIDLGAWDDEHDGASWGNWGGGTWRHHWESTWWLDRDRDRGFLWNSGKTRPRSWRWRRAAGE